jgi:hypothetical protein
MHEINVNAMNNCALALFFVHFFCLFISCEKKSQAEKISTDSRKMQSEMDTGRLETKAQLIWERLQDERIFNGGCDTLMDVNGDIINDLVITHYGNAGSGMKYLATVFLYITGKETFEECEQLAHALNPTFNLANNTVFCWYIGNGGGDGTKLKWNKDKCRLDTLEFTEIQVRYSDHLEFHFSKTDYATGNTTSWTSREMPAEYSYEPIIKKKDCY